jgi:hypothetical protein
MTPKTIEPGFIQAPRVGVPWPIFMVNASLALGGAMILIAAVLR